MSDFTPEQNIQFRQNLIRDYEELLRDFEAAYERRGATFGMWLTGEQRRLVMGALEYQLDVQRAALTTGHSKDG